MPAELLPQIQGHMDREEWDRVVELAAEHGDIVQRSFELSWNAGWALFKLERFAESTPHFRRALLLVSREDVRGSVIARWGLGLALREQGLYAEAEQRLLGALELRDGYLPRLALANLYVDLDRIAEAEQVFREGVRLRPKDRRRLEALADFLYDQGRSEEAEQLYAQAAELPAPDERSRGFSE